MTTREALDKLAAAQDVEAAYRAQAAGAVERYNREAHNPHSPAADHAWKLRREALAQWKKARLDVADAKARWGTAQRQEYGARRRVNA